MIGPSSLEQIATRFARKRASGVYTEITDVRAPGFACRAVDGRLEGQFVSQGNLSTTTNLNVACPVPDVYNGVHNITTVDVAFNDQSSVASPTAQRCVSLFSASGVSCGPVASAPASLLGFFTPQSSKERRLPDTPPEGDPPSSVRAKLLFECASWRSAGSQMLELGRSGTADGN